MSWLNEEGEKGNWMQAGRNENPLGTGWLRWTQSSLPHVDESERDITIGSFFTKLGKFFFGLRKIYKTSPRTLHPLGVDRISSAIHHQPQTKA